MGTPWATVTRSVPRRRSASAAVQCGGVMTVVITRPISSKALVMVPTWAKGSGESRRSKGAERTPEASATAARLAWSKRTPLGLPVVPPVQQMATGEPGPRVASGGGAEALHPSSSPHPTTPPADGGRRPPVPSSTTVTLGVDRSRM